MDPLFDIPEDLAALTAEELQQFIDVQVARLEEIAAAPREFVTEERDSAQLRTEMAEAVEAVREARELLSEFEAEPADGEPAEPTEPAATEPTEPTEPTEDDEELAAEAARLAAEARVELDPAIEPEPAAVDPEPEPIVAAAATPPARRSRPARSRRATPPSTQVQRVALTAAAAAPDLPMGHEFVDPRELADAMVRRHSGFVGVVPEGSMEKYVIGRADWRDRYPEERTLIGKDATVQQALVAAVVDEEIVRRNFESRRNADTALTASGGLCAPVTPYYGLQMISQATRPMRAALPSFNADRGGINAAAPASLADIGIGVGQITAAQDEAGGTAGTKTCQIVDCPPFSETVVEVLYHCLQFGNLGARTFPERVAQWNSLVMAAHARLGERALLTGIDVASTAVTAASLGLGATADWLGEVMAAAEGMRSRHRMDPEAVLRLVAPRWLLSLLVSDYYRRQFSDFDLTAAQIISLLRAANVEPTWYIDSAAGRGQEFGVQSAGALLSFPSAATWYLYPEGSFLYLDGGTLELGLVRDSTLNSTNDFQIFGESFENVAFIGVESLAVTSTLCDSGITAGTHNPICPIDYTHTS